MSNRKDYYVAEVKSEKKRKFMKVAKVVIAILALLIALMSSIHWSFYLLGYLVIMYTYMII